MFGHNQIIIFLELDGFTEDEKGSSYCVRLTLPEAPEVIGDLIRCYSQAMEDVALQLAAGGCRTCDNTRMVKGEQCPVCVPRAHKRLREKVWPRRPWRSGDNPV